MAQRNKDGEPLTIDEILITRPADFHQDDYDRAFVTMADALRETRDLLTECERQYGNVEYSESHMENIRSLRAKWRQRSLV